MATSVETLGMVLREPNSREREDRSAMLRVSLIRRNRMFQKNYMRTG